MKRYEFMALRFQDAEGRDDVTPLTATVLAKLNELGAQGWAPSPFGRPFLQREIPEPERRESKPFSPLIKAAPAEAAR